MAFREPATACAREALVLCFLLVLARLCVAPPSIFREALKAASYYRRCVTLFQGLYVDYAFAALCIALH